MWMGFWRGLFTLSATFLLFQAVPETISAKTLVISDIDDTIKVSHILNWGGKLSRAADVTTPFRGMSELYQLLRNEQGTHIFYLSNAPRRLVGVPALDVSHRTFLSLNNFPYGEVLLREDMRDPHHKITELRRLVRVERPDIVILVGDNGEKDPEVYEQFRREYGTQVRILTFIHQLYSTERSRFVPGFLGEVGAEIYPEQVGYVTPVEIALELKEQGLLAPDSAAWMVRNIAPKIVAEGQFKWDGLKPITFPAFKKCAEFRWRWPLTVDVLPLHGKISSVCN